MSSSLIAGLVNGRNSFRIIYLLPIPDPPRRRVLLFSLPGSCSGPGYGSVRSSRSCRLASHQSASIRSMPADSSGIFSRASSRSIKRNRPSNRRFVCRSSSSLVRPPETGRDCSQQTGDPPAPRRSPPTGRSHRLFEFAQLLLDLGEDSRLVTPVEPDLRRSLLQLFRPVERRKRMRDLIQNRLRAAEPACSASLTFRQTAVTSSGVSAFSSPKMCA